MVNTAKEFFNKNTHLLLLFIISWAFNIGLNVVCYSHGVLPVCSRVLHSILLNSFW